MAHRNRKELAEKFDEWEKDLFYLSQIYGDPLVNKINELIDEGKIEEVNLIIKYLK